MVARRTPKSKGAKMTKLDTLKTAAAAGDWQTAFSIAARFPRLGAHRNAILDAHMAFTNPRFLAQVRRPQPLRTSRLWLRVWLACQ